MSDKLEKQREMMEGVARAIDRMFNPDPASKANGFILMVFPFDAIESPMNYLSNASREEVLTAVDVLKEQLRKAMS